MAKSNFFQPEVRVTLRESQVVLPVNIEEFLLIKREALSSLESQKNNILTVYNKTAINVIKFKEIINNEAYTEKEKEPFKGWLERNLQKFESNTLKLEELNSAIQAIQSEITALELEIEAHQPPGPSL